MAKMSPKSEAIAYRAYIWAHDRGWDCTIAECAEAIGVGSKSLRTILVMKGWSNRFRSSRLDRHDFNLDQSRPNATPYKLGLAQLRDLGVEIELDF